MEQEEVGVDGVVEFDVGAGAAEGAFGEGDGEAAIGKVVRGFRQAGLDDVADGALHVLLVGHVERRGHSKHFTQDLFCILSAAHLGEVRAAEAAEQDDLAARVLERDGDRGAGGEQADDAHDGRRKDSPRRASRCIG